LIRKIQPAACDYHPTYANTLLSKEDIAKVAKNMPRPLIGNNRIVDRPD
jgi:hypothetical protein